MTIPLYHVDAFTERPFAGNPAAVCILDAWKEERWLQGVAREVNLPETAFLVSTGDQCDLRWFTPKVDVDLCGHATLASAHVLWHALHRGRPVHYQAAARMCVRRQREHRHLYAMLTRYLNDNLPAGPKP